MSIQITFSKDQFRELLLDVMLGASIRGGLADQAGEDWESYEAIQTFLLEQAQDANFSDLFQRFEGSLLPSEVLCKEEEKITEEYEDDVFLFELETRLGKRDLEETLTNAEIKQMEKEHWLPERVHELYEVYEEEFEEYGIDRLRIVE